MYVTIQTQSIYNDDKQQNLKFPVNLDRNLGNLLHTQWNSEDCDGLQQNCLSSLYCLWLELHFVDVAWWSGVQ